ncbi:MAG: aminotransferase class IV [Gemmataceae bacterium]
MSQSENELAEVAGGFIHDLKNHLSTLSLNLQLLGEEFGDAQSQKERRALDRVEKLRGECQRLVDISNDFLRFARVKELDRLPTDLLGFVEEMVDFFGPMARSHGIDIQTYIPAGLPPVPLDRELFKQALLNLLLNAQQAMPKGGEITLQATAEPGAVLLSVIDTGKGMTPEQLAKAFKPFHSTRTGGTGLGLPTTKKILEAHGGSLSAESAPGKGTRFTVRLPAADGKAGPATLCVLNGVRMPVTEARVSVLDRGFLFGDGIYEVMRVFRGRCWLEDDHFARFKRSLTEIKIHGVDLERLRKQAHETIAAGGFRDAVVYMQVTRGAAPRGHAFPANARPTELLWVQETGDPYRELRERGMAVSLHPDLRWKRCDVKSVNLLANVLANQAAKEAGAAEAVLYLSDGTLTEASHSSFFGVVDGHIRTTPDSPGILPGVTRKLTLELAAKAGVPVEMRSLNRDDLPRASELFMTGTSLQVCPIVTVDGAPVANGQPGPVTRKLQAAYEEKLRAFLSDAMS